MSRLLPQRIIALVTLLLVSCMDGNSPSAPVLDEPQFTHLPPSTTFTVNSADDLDDAVCDATHCSLREAINASNAATDVSAVEFAIPGQGPHVITPSSPLPEITSPVYIDGYTQPGSSPNTAGPSQGTNAVLMIVLDGHQAGSTADGFILSAGESLVRGLVIHSFAGYGIRATTHTGTGVPIRVNNVIEGNFIGTDANGTVVMANGNGVILENVRTSTVGGTAAAARNVISGNNAHGVTVTGGASRENVIAGNLIGTDRNGTADLGNAINGILVESAVLRTDIGGVEAAARNVISGNGQFGIRLISLAQTAQDSTRIINNYVGTDVTGMSAIPNGVTGIVINGALHTQIGGRTAAERNIISGNSGHGLYLYPLTVVEGNYIGLNASGAAALPNRGDGITVQELGGSGTIGGSAPGAGNSISGNLGSGISFSSQATVGIIEGNIIGLDPSGTVPIPNADGISITRGNPRIGGTSPGAGNVISGNHQNGIFLFFPGSEIIGNTIGSDRSHSLALGNGSHGVFLFNARAVLISANFIANNGGAGIAINQPPPPLSQLALENRITENTITDNAQLGIDLLPPADVNANDALDADVGANLLQNYPTITDATPAGTITGTLESAPSIQFRIELFANVACDALGHGEGERFLQAVDVTTDGAGSAAFSASIAAGLASGGFITATATDPDGNTSEFSACVEVAGAANGAPTADVGGPYSGVEGQPIALTLGGTDPDGDVLTFTWDLGDGTTGTGPTPPTTHTYADNPAAPATAYTITLTADDGLGGVDTKSTTVTVANVAPTASFTAPGPVSEGSSFTLSLTDPQDVAADLPTLEYRFDCGSGFEDWSASTSRVCAADDDGQLAVVAEIRDKDGGVSRYTGSVSVLNATPSLGAVIVPLDPIPAGTPVTATASFTDSGPKDTHTGFVQWDLDGPFEPAVPGVDQAAKKLTATSTLVAGVYSIALRVNDDDGGEGTAAASTFVVVFDASDEHVTGGGWFMSPAGTYSPDPALAGKASFGFVAKLKAGASQPSGNTEFHFAVAGLKFKSSSYQWLVVSGARARFKGEGSVNGVVGYGFMVTARDGALTGGLAGDAFRMKIWSLATGEIVYDNQPGQSDDSDAGTELGGGSIVIHKN